MEKNYHADQSDRHYRGKRNSTLFGGYTEDELKAKKERINTRETASEDDDDESGEINVVDTSDNEAEFSLKRRLELQFLSSASPVSFQCSNLVHKPVIKSNSLDEEVVDEDDNARQKLKLSNRYSFESPLDLSYKNNSGKDGVFYFKNNDDRNRKSQSLNNPGDAKLIISDLTINNDHEVCTSQQMVRRSVIKSLDQDQSFSNVEEHFRRSLGRHAFAAFSQPKGDYCGMIHGDYSGKICLIHHDKLKIISLGRWAMRGRRSTTVLLIERKLLIIFKVDTITSISSRDFSFNLFLLYK
uniref:Uncharacterized protein n=1 Tax=Romanomermis culicivorax TaxID=13658 RepID=A0A915KKP6_ROMCU